MDAREILELEYGKSKNFMTPRILGRGLIDQYTAYELSKGRGMSNQEIYGLSIVSYLPEFGITRRHTSLVGLFYSSEKAKRYISELKKHPGIVEAELSKLDSWKCPHGVNRWHHPECWLFHLTGKEKYKVLVDRLNDDLKNNHEKGAGI